MATRILKTAFTAGELDPRLARPEMEQYFYGAEKLRNVFVQPQGGVRRRPATRFDAALTKYQSVIFETPGAGPGENVFDFSASFNIANAADIKVYVLEGEPDGIPDFIAWYELVLTTHYTVDVGADTLTLPSPFNTPGPGNTGTFYQIVWTAGAQVSAVGRTDTVRMEPFSFSTQQEYLIILLPFTLHVFKDVAGVMTLQATLDTFFSSDDLDTVSFTQQLDSMLIFHKSRKTQHLQRQGSDTTWAISDWAYVNQPKRRFGNTYPGSAGLVGRTDQIVDLKFSATFEDTHRFTIVVNGEETDQIVYNTTAVNHVEQIFFDSFTNLDTYKLRVDGELTASIVYSSTPATNETNLQTAIRNLANTSATGVTVAEFGSGDDKYRITFASDDGAAAWDISSESISGSGTISLTETVVGVATTVTNLIAAIAALDYAGTPSITTSGAVDFQITMDATADQGKEFVFQEGVSDFDKPTNFLTFLVKARGMPYREDVWSTGGSTPRGYPRCGTFHQGRLWVAGSANLPQTLWGSRSGNFLDFDSSRVDDDYGMEVDGDTDSVTAFINIYSGRHLVLLSDTAEFYIPTASNNIGVTPTNIALRRSSGRGSKEGIGVVESDGAILFVQKGGRALRELLFDELESSYITRDLAALSPHLVITPKDIAHRMTVDLDNTNYVNLVNTDGSLAVLNRQRKENVNAWTLATTRGFYEAVASIQTNTYVIISRNISTNQLFLETFDDTLLLDSGAQASGVSVTSVSSGIAHLNGETVEIIIEGEHAGYEVLSGGTVNFVDLGGDPVTVTSWQIGLPFPDVDGGDGETWVKTMPVILQGDGGATSAGKQIRVLSADVSYLDTRHMRIRHDLEQPTVAFNHIEQIFFDSFTNLDIYKLRVDGELTASIVYSSTPATNETNLQTAIRNLANTSATGVTVAEFGSGNAEYRITFASDDGAVAWDISSESISGSGTIYLTEIEVGAAAIRANDNLITFQRLGGSLLDGQTPLFSGDNRVEGLLGWTRRAQLSFTQEHAAEMNITSVAVKVRV